MIKRPSSAQCLVYTVPGAAEPCLVTVTVRELRVRN